MADTSSSKAFEVDPQTWEWFPGSFEWKCGKMVVVNGRLYGMDMERRLGEMWAEEREEEEKEVWRVEAPRRMRRVGTDEENPFEFFVFEDFWKDDEGVRVEVRTVPFGSDVLEWKGHLVVLGGLDPHDVAGEGRMRVYDVVCEEVARKLRRSCKEVATLAGLRSCTLVGCAVVTL